MNEELENSFIESLEELDFRSARIVYDENRTIFGNYNFSEIAFYHTYKETFEVIKFLHQLGLDLNKTRNNSSLFRDACSSDVTFEQLKWLHDNGADINFTHKGTNQNCLLRLITKGRFEEIKYFISKGMEYNFVFLRRDFGSGEVTNVQTPVDCALQCKCQDIADYLISLGVKPATKEQIEKYMPPKKSLLTKLFGKKVNERKEFVEYLENEVGEISKLSLKEIVGDLEIVSIDPSDDIPWRTLLTYGVSKTEMETSEDDLKYCEFAIQVPSDWPLDNESLKKQEYFWPIVWLRKLSNYPFETNTLLKDQNTISGDDTKSFAPNTKLNSFLLIQDPDLHGTMLSNNKFINIYTLIPLYHEECEDIKKNGVVPVLTKFEENVIGQTVEIDRPNVITGEGL